MGFLKNFSSLEEISKGQCGTLLLQIFKKYPPRARVKFMDKERVLKTLRDHERELKALGVEHLTLFGSVARDEADPDSDVDLLATFNKAKRLSLLKVVAIQRKMSDLLGCSVDLGELACVKPRLKPYIASDLIDVF